MNLERFDPIHLFYLDERMTRRGTSKCEDADCPGWYFDVELARVVRCAECARFKDDRSAQGHVRRALAEKAARLGFPKHKSASAWGHE